MGDPSDFLDGDPHQGNESKIKEKLKIEFSRSVIFFCIDPYLDKKHSGDISGEFLES